MHMFEKERASLKEKKKKMKVLVSKQAAHKIYQNVTDFFPKKLVYQMFLITIYIYIHQIYAMCNVWVKLTKSKYIKLTTLN